MKRIFLILMILALLSGGALAEGYNSFMDDRLNAGRFDRFAWDGEYVYWLHTPDDGSWADPPANLYRMVPGGFEAELLLEGREDLYIYHVLNIGKKLLLSVADAGGGQTHPALINFDGSGYEVLPGNIGSVVLGDGVIYNSADGGIYGISVDTMKPRRIYSYPKEILKQIPILMQYADGKLYFYTDGDERAQYELNLETGKARRIADVRGSGFVLDGMLYIADYDKLDGTWKYDIATGNRVRVSERIYDFEQGSGNVVRATGDDAESWFQGALFDFSKLKDDLEAVRVGDCDENYDVMLGGRLLHYDWQNNRVEWSNTPIFGMMG